jgi:hypothetical protein
VGVHSRAEPVEKIEPGIPAKIFLGAQLFRSPEESSLPAAFACLSVPHYLQPFVWNLTPFLYAAVCGIFRRCCVVAVPAPLPGARYAWQSDFACGDSAPRRYSVPLYRLGAANFQALELFLPTSGIPFGIRQCLGPPLRVPPIKWGPVRYAPCFFLIFAGKLKHPETYRL